MVCSLTDVFFWTQNLCSVFFILLFSLPFTIVAISFTLVIVPTIFFSEVSVLRGLRITRVEQTVRARWWSLRYNACLLALCGED